jgi:anti-sigma regulatory factor (Ser/Thr protein kinase)
MGLQARPQPNALLDLDVPARAEELLVVREAFAHLSLPDPLLSDARLLVNELVTNSIRHADLGPDDRIRVIARISGGRLRVDVIEGGHTETPGPVMGAIRPTPGAVSGWGLFLVETLASRWGLSRDRYWFEIELESAAGRASSSDPPR